MEHNLNLNIFSLLFSLSPALVLPVSQKRMELLIQNQNNTYTFKLKDFNH